MRGTPMFPRIYIPQNISVPGYRSGGVAIQMDFLPEGDNVESFPIAVSEGVYFQKVHQAYVTGSIVELDESEYAKLPTLLGNTNDKSNYSGN